MSAVRTPVPAVPVGLLTAILLAAMCGCSGAGTPGTSGRSSAATTPSAGLASPTATPTTSPTTSPTAAAGPRTTSRPTTAGDGEEQRIAVLRTEGGVPSLVIRLTATGTVTAVQTCDLSLGQTLRLIVVSPVATHLVGAGLGVDTDVRAGDPAAVDVVSFTAGSYMITTRAGTVIARLQVGR